MKRLLEQFTGRGEVKGFTFRQTFRTETVAMYGVCPSFEEAPHFGSPSHYEVFKIKSSINYLGDGTESEYYPKANSFGTSAWTYKDAGKAMDKYDQLKKEEKEKV